MLKVSREVTKVDMSNEILADQKEDGDSGRLPRTIWLVGVVSFFSNMSSVVITAFSPEFIINILGGTPAAMGYIRGISEALSYLMKMFSGVISDLIGKRKILMLLGYLCAAFAKPMFAFVRE